MGTTSGLLYRISQGCVLAAAGTIAAGCATQPTSKNYSEPKVVAVDADALSREYSSFNARVLRESVEVDHRFVASLDPNVETLTRLESTYTQRVGGDESVRVGDAVSSAGMWGSTVRYGGMQFGTQSNSRSDVVASTRLATTGVAVLPTVADTLFASAAAGRSESINAPMIASTRLIEQGCADFSMGMGKVRRDYAIVSNDYGPLFANTTVACAAPLGLTIEGHGEYLADEVSALGVGVARQLGPIGTASAAFAQSRTDVGSGWLARFGFEHQSSMFNVMLRSRMQSREFREIATAALTDPVMQRDLASIGINVAEGSSLSLAYATQVTWARERTNLVALKQSMSVGRGSLSMSAGHSLADNFGSTLFISYKRPLGGTRPARSAIEEFDVDILNGASAAPATRQ